MRKTSFAERFATARIEAGCSVAEIAARLKVSTQAVYGYEKGAMPRGDRMNALASMLGVSVQWLAYGENGTAPSFCSETGGISVPVLDVIAGAGQMGGDVDAVVVRFLELDPEWVAVTIPHANRAALKVHGLHGDSMEPTFHNNDLLLVDTSVTRITRDGIYVVRFDDLIYVKRFQRIPGNRLVMISDNPFYKPVDINPSEGGFEVLGAVVFSWHGEKR